MKEKRKNTLYGIEMLLAIIVGVLIFIKNPNYRLLIVLTGSTIIILFIIESMKKKYNSKNIPELIRNFKSH